MATGRKLNNRRAVNGNLIIIPSDPRMASPGCSTKWVRPYRNMSSVVHDRSHGLAHQDVAKLDLEHMLKLFLMACCPSTRTCLSGLSRQKPSFIKRAIITLILKVFHHPPIDLRRCTRTPNRFSSTFHNGWRTWRKWSWRCHRIVILGDSDVRICGLWWHSIRL